MYIALGIAAVVIVFIAVLLIRAALFRPASSVTEPGGNISFDNERFRKTLSEMIKCRTVSSSDKSQEDESEFIKFKDLLPKLFPSVFEKCTVEYPSDRSILIRWAGKRSESPTVLMAHYDVVSVVSEGWDKDAFSGEVENGFLWGRGTLDTKGTLNGILGAAETLISDGFIPETDMYFAFAGDEEINGYGASAIVDLFKTRGIVPGMVLDEGGAVVENVFPGVKKPCALIGIAEKGMLNLEFSYSGNGGHASAPPPHTPVGKLSAACVKVEGHPFKASLSVPAAKMFDTLGRHSGFAFKILFANIKLFMPLLSMITKKSGGELNALLRTTVAFTQMEGSKGMNVIPPHASMVANLRLAPGTTMDDARSYIEKTVSDGDIKLRVIGGMDPSAVSRTDGDGWDRLENVISETWPGSLVSPYLMVACSDSRHWGRISDRVYRFSAMALSKEERGYIHGNNERIPLETLDRTVEFYIRLMKKS